MIDLCGSGLVFAWYLHDFMDSRSTKSNPSATQKFYYKKIIFSVRSMKFFLNQHEVKNLNLCKSLLSVSYVTKKSKTFFIKKNKISQTETRIQWKFFNKTKLNF